MKPQKKGTIFRSLLVMLCSLTLVFGNCPVNARALSPLQTPTPTPQAASGDQPASGQSAKIPPDQLDSLVAPIALYPDPLLAQTLAASTYPLEIIQLQQWLEKNSKLKEKELADAVAKQSWDPSIQAMAALPDVVKRLADDIQWTTDLGNAFLAQQSEVMEAVQRMRKKAQDKGTLKSNEEQKVETKVVESKSVIVVEQANPQVVYVPAYNPTVVYGAPVYAYPPIYYPSPGYYAAGAAISFGVGVAMGAMWSGGWGWNSGWGGNNVQINNYNNFNRNANVNRNVNANRTGNWSHNSQHRGGAPYRDQATANRYGGTARGESMSNRQAGARQQVSQQGGNMPSTRSGGGSAGDRAAGASNGGNRPSGSGAGRSGGGADSIGSRDVSRSSGGGRDAFSGGSGGFNGASARSNSSRGASSMGSRGGGGRGGGRRR
jgi:Protein of unknown function (DUF3300)